MSKNPSQQTELTYKKQTNACQSLGNKCMKNNLKKNNGKKFDIQEFSYLHQVHP